MRDGPHYSSLISHIRWGIGGWKVVQTPLTKSRILHRGVTGCSPLQRRQRKFSKIEFKMVHSDEIDGHSFPVSHPDAYIIQEDRIYYIFRHFAKNPALLAVTWPHFPRCTVLLRGPVSCAPRIFGLAPPLGLRRWNLDDVGRVLNFVTPQNGRSPSDERRRRQPRRG